MLLILVHILIVVLVITAGDVVHPLLVVQVPVDGQHDTLLERGLRVPAQIVLDLGGVDAVTAVMAQTVGHMLDQVLADALVLQTVMQLVDDGLDDEDVGALVVALNGEKLKPAAIIAKLNEIGGRNGIGLYDVVENRLVGMKSRGVYETPGGTILYKAHEVLETLTLDKLTAHKKRELAITFGELVYDGQWFSPLRKALSAFVTSTQEHVTGKVRLELYKGNLINAGVWSPYSLYREDIATFAAGGDYKQSDATGFISIYGLPTKVQAIVNSEKEGQ